MRTRGLVTSASICKEKEHCESHLLSTESRIGAKQGAKESKAGGSIASSFASNDFLLYNLFSGVH